MQTYMAKKNKTLKTVTIVIVGILGLFIIAGFFTTMKQKGKMEEWSKIVAKTASDLKTGTETKQLYAKGETVDIPMYEYDQMVQYYTLNDMSEEDAEKNADIYVKERYAIYAEAIREGYDTTEEEIAAYIEEVKEDMADRKNKETREMIIKAFGSEEAYWEYEEVLCEIDLPIKNYINSLEEAYEKENTDAKDSEWAKEFETIKDTLIEKENFQLVSQS